MRTIIFRGKRVDTGEWVYGYLTYILWHDSYYINSGRYNSPNHEVHPSTVGQFTGLSDKNGNEIYEGDVVEYEYCNHIDKTTVSYSLYEAGFYPFTKPAFDGYEWESCNAESCEIIGNIHDNPDLI